MNYRVSLILVVGVLAVAAASAFAQAREISKEEYQATNKAAYAKLDNATYRVKWTHASPASIGTERGELISSVSEFAPQDRRRVVTTWKTPKGTRTEETIKVGDKEFMKTDDGPWEDLTKKRFDRFTIVGDAASQEKVTETYRHLGIDRVRGLEAEIFEEIVYREEVYDNRTIGYSNLTRLWISKDGRLLKRESKHSGSNGLVTSSSISEYEYDPNIKIELPNVGRE